MTVDPHLDTTVSLIQREQFSSLRFRGAVDYAVAPPWGDAVDASRCSRPPVPSVTPPVLPCPDPLAPLAWNLQSLRVFAACRRANPVCLGADAAVMPARPRFPVYRTGLPLRSASGIDIFA